MTAGSVRVYNTAMVALLVIGDEILSGDIREENISFMIDTLKRAGHRTGEIRIIGDDVEAIATAFRELSTRYEYVVSAGGVGPTHDDVTLEGAARGFGVELELHPGMAAFLAAHYGHELTGAARRMAMLPSDSEIIPGREHRWPVIRKGNAFILPGLPVALRDKMVRVAEMIPSREEGEWVAVLYIHCDETEIAEWLLRLQEQNEGVKIGSYPVIEERGYHTRITIKGDDHRSVERTFALARSYFQKGGWLLGANEPEMAQ